MTNPRTPKLTVHNAELRTATVEVKTLTISGKQVTLAVFRQLLETDLVAVDGSLNGVPWGVVNYHPDKCADRLAHIHVVWQLGEELRRSRVLNPDVRPRYQAQCTDEFGAASICQRDDGLVPNWMTHEFSSTTGKHEFQFEVDGVRCAAAIPNPFHGRGRGHQCPSGDDLKRIDDEFWDAVAIEKERRGRHDAQWLALNDLPQLFIAV